MAAVQTGTLPSKLAYLFCNGSTVRIPFPRIDTPVASTEPALALYRARRVGVYYRFAGTKQNARTLATHQRPAARSGRRIPIESPTGTGLVRGRAAWRGDNKDRFRLSNRPVGSQRQPHRSYRRY